MAEASPGPVVTGIAASFPLSKDVERLFELATASGRGAPPPPATGCLCLSAPAQGPEGGRDDGATGRGRPLPRLARLALAAARAAWRDCVLPAVAARPDRLGLFLVSTDGLLDDIVRFEQEVKRHGLIAARPHLYQELTLGATAGHIAIDLGMNGPVTALIGGRCGGHLALSLAEGAVRSGRVDVALVGAVEASGRVPLVGADAGAFVVLESSEHASRRRARVYCEILGTAFSVGHGDDPSFARRRLLEGALSGGFTDRRDSFPRLFVSSTSPCGDPDAEGARMVESCCADAAGATLLPLGCRLAGAASASSILGVLVAARWLSSTEPAAASPPPGAVGGPRPPGRSAVVGAVCPSGGASCVVLGEVPARPAVARRVRHAMAAC